MLSRLHTTATQGWHTESTRTSGPIPTVSSEQKMRRSVSVMACTSALVAAVSLSRFGHSRVTGIYPEHIFPEEILGLGPRQAEYFTQLLRWNTQSDIVTSFRSTQAGRMPNRDPTLWWLFRRAQNLGSGRTAGLHSTNWFMGSTHIECGTLDVSRGRTNTLLSQSYIQ